MKTQVTAAALMAALSSTADAGRRQADPADGAPALATYTDQLVYGELWDRDVLSRRDRSLVTVAALVANGRTSQLQFHFGRALDHGVTPVELSELVTHVAFIHFPRLYSSVFAAITNCHPTSGLAGACEIDRHGRLPAFV